MHKLLLTTLVALSLINPSFACTIDGSEGFVPENDLNLTVDAKGINTIDEAKFNEVIDKVVAVYEPLVRSEGGTLKVERNWTDGTVNAYASRNGGTWNVAMFGGLARHSAITEDGFALVVCHEIGHHIGGAPKKAGWFSTWASNEGQADYFATLKCLRKTFRSEDNKAIVAQMNVPEVVIQSCATQFANEEDRLICQRGAMAGMSTAKLFQDLRRQSTEPKFDTPDARTVTRTDDNHPDTQCRLDTYYTGALCDVIDADDVSQKDEVTGTCHAANGHSIGLRPRCWFKPKS